MAAAMRSTNTRPLVGAVETAGGNGELIHPILGSLQIIVRPRAGGFLRVLGRMDEGRVLSFTMLCLESGEKEFPSASQDTGARAMRSTPAADDSGRRCRRRGFRQRRRRYAIADGQDVLNEAGFNCKGIRQPGPDVRRQCRRPGQTVLQSLPGNFGPLCRRRKLQPRGSSREVARLRPSSVTRRARPGSNRAGGALV